MIVCEGRKHVEYHESTKRKGEMHDMPSLTVPMKAKMLSVIIVPRLIGARAKQAISISITQKMAERVLPLRVWHAESAPLLYLSFSLCTVLLGCVLDS